MELIFEIGCEELPARFVFPALEQIEEMFDEKCSNLRLDYGTLETVGTPRRLTLLVDGLDAKQKDLEETQTGPPADVAFDGDEPTGAAKGFASAKGVDVEELYTLETDKGEFAAADIHEQGAPTHRLLPEMLEELIQNLHFPKSMRWASYDERFGRPVRWLLAVAGGDVIDLEFAGVESSNLSRGHEFAANETFEVDSIEAYRQELQQRHVVVDPAERRSQIQQKLHALCDDVGGELREDPELIDEVVNLVEEPHATLLDFDDTYLELPDEVLVTSMRSHQRYFSIQDPDSEDLMSYCGVIYNTPVKDPETVNQGNLRVLRARLDDAKFFWNKDRQKHLEEYVDSLGEVVWIDALGSIKERSHRISKLAGRIAEVIDVDEDKIDAAQRAGLLSKADLVTEMVNEFPKLQGTMGAEYALESGESEAVASGIREQYLPEGKDDEPPQTDVGAVVALSEKLDSIIGCFGVGMIPDSNSDPYGLRRAALGIVRILSDNAYRAGIPELLRASLGVYDETLGDVFESEDDELVEDISTFIRTRLRYWLCQDHPTDVVDAVLEVNERDVNRIIGLVSALSKLRNEADFLPLARAYKRIENILEKESTPEDSDFSEELLKKPEEKALYEAYRKHRKSISGALEQRDWNRSCRALIEMKPAVDDFFDTVMVMADNANLRRNRVALLHKLRNLFRSVADIGHIQAD